MSLTVELFYDKDCPHVAATRANLLRAFEAAGVPAMWTEWEQSSPEAPGHLRGFGSPTVLVEGSDVAGAQPVEGLACCRLYEREDGRGGVPPVGLIAGALSHAKERTIANLSAASGSGRRASWASVLVVPGIVAALLPSLTCPLCWPAYAGVLSSLGVGFVGTTAYLLPLTATFLAIAVGALTFGARRHGRHGPLALGLVGSAIVLLGKFVLDATPATLGGVGMLVVASVWNVWPRRATVLPCPACVPGATGTTKATVTEVSS